MNRLNLVHECLNIIEENTRADLKARPKTRDPYYCLEERQIQNDRIRKRLVMWRALRMYARMLATT